MKERPVIFNSEMVCAILDGRKTQTRRIAKADNSNHLLGCPFGQVGDRLWVRETFAAFDADWKHPGKPHDLRDGPWPNVVYPASVAKIPDGTCRPSIHMPRWASRITLEITSVRVERLRDSSDLDLLDELGDMLDDCDSIAGKAFNHAEHYAIAGIPVGMIPEMHGFKAWWDSLHGFGNFESNPWVWVIEFKRAEAQETAL
jgi:hypothetical protein